MRANGTEDAPPRLQDLATGLSADCLAGAIYLGPTSGVYFVKDLYVYVSGRLCSDTVY